MNVKNYIIAIPTYKRSKIIGENTLKVLKNRKIDKNKIYLFVANKEEEKDYLKDIDNSLYGNIIIGKKGLKNQRNFITDFFPENKYIVEMDDDIKEIYELIPGEGDKRLDIQKSQKLKKLDNLNKFFEESFTRLLTNNTDLIMNKKNNILQQNNIPHIWGIYPVDNPYFLSNKITNNLQFLVGPMWGKINRHDKNLKLNLDEKEDFERTLRHYKKDGFVLRYWNVTISTSYYKTPGGMQAENKDRYKEAEISANYLVEMFPEYTTKWYKGKTKRPEVKLKDKKK